jgi:Tol biopolymer transport system component
MKIKLVTTVFLIVVLGVFLSLAGSVQQTDDPGVLLRAAIEKEEVEGDLQGAINLYKQIVAKYGDNRTVAAKAQLRIGMCYEKLGLREAQNAYQKVIENYPQQHEEVRAAEERISQLSKALAAAPGKPKFRKINIPTEYDNGVLSPDGKKLAFTSEGSLWMIPIPGKVQPNISGEPIKLTESTKAWNLLSTLAWSGDGKWIAFNVDQRSTKCKIYIVSSEGDKPKEILIRNLRRGSDPLNYRLSLSSDGKILAFCNLSEDKEQGLCIYTVPVEGGEEKLFASAARLPAFSPDGTKIAYVKAYVSKDGKWHSDVFVSPISRESAVQVSQLDSGFPNGIVWSPDGSMIAFTPAKEDGHSSREVWIVPLSKKGKPLSSPTKIKLPQEMYDITAGWTHENRIGLNLWNPIHKAVYTVPVSGGKATQVTPAGYPDHPRWSIDGKRILFRWNYGTIAFVPAEGGEPTTIPLCIDYKFYEAVPGGGNNISPDGEMIVLSGVETFDSESGSGVNIYTLPIEGGEPFKVTQSPLQDRFPCWSTDGNSIAFIRYGGEKKDEWPINICIVSSTGREVRQITSAENKVANSTIDWTPDGKSITYFSEDKTINNIPIAGGKPEIITEVNSVFRHNELSWSPDGQMLAFTSEGKIWLVPKEGGEAVEVETDLDANVDKIGWSPDGKKIAFTAETGGDRELWLMEDFLHLIKGRK